MLQSRSAWSVRLQSKLRSNNATSSGANGRGISITSASSPSLKRTPDFQPQSYFQYRVFSQRTQLTSYARAFSTSAQRRNKAPPSVTKQNVCQQAKERQLENEQKEAESDFIDESTDAKYTGEVDLELNTFEDIYKAARSYYGHFLPEELLTKEEFEKFKLIYGDPGDWPDLEEEGVGEVEQVPETRDELAYKESDFIEGEDYEPYSLEDRVKSARDLFGSNVPANYLNEEEFEIYQRLCGKPTRTLSEGQAEEGDDVELGAGKGAF